MKVELKGNDTKNSKPYPKLMKNTATGSIWLMSRTERGLALYVTPSSAFGLGDSSSTLDMGNLRDYEGSICLSND